MFFRCGTRVTHWGRVTHIRVDNPTIIGSDNGLSPGRRQAIIWTNARILLICQTFNRNSYIFIQANPFQNFVWKMAAMWSRPQCVDVMRSDDVCLRQWTGPSLFQVMDCCLTTPILAEKINTMWSNLLHLKLNQIGVFSFKEMDL